jgi:hypothetical protein
LVDVYESAGTPLARRAGYQKRSSDRSKSQSANPYAGRQFIEALPPLVDSQQSGVAGLFRAWAEDQGKTNAAVLKAIGKSMDIALAVTKGVNKDYRGR